MASVALVKQDSAESALTAFEPRDMNGLVELCKMLHASGLMPRAVNRWEAAVFIAMKGRELGLTLTQAFSSIHVIDGKAVLSADLMVASVKRSPLCQAWRVVQSTPEQCTIEAQRVGDEGTTSLTWTMKDAERAGLAGKDTWRKYPRAMLRARCSAELARTVFPELAMGLYDTDEIQAPERREYEPTRPGPARAAAPPPPSTPDGEIVDEQAHDKAAFSFKTELSRIGRDGTIAELKAVGAQIGRAGLPTAYREALKEAYAMASAAIAARNAPPSEPDAAEGEP
jgi:hypothetical protein